MKNTVELLENNIIYVQKVGDQTEASLLSLHENISKIAQKLRAQGKPVLILSNAEKEGKMDPDGIKMAVKVGIELDYDKSASFGSSAYLRGLRQLLTSGTQLDQKVANFKTRGEAIDWLLH